jgi:hypothetical protein
MIERNPRRTRVVVRSGRALVVRAQFMAAWTLLVTSPDALIRARAALFASRVYGFKLRPPHYSTQSIRAQKAFLSGLQAEGWRLVHLRRRNVLRVALSSLRREQTKIVHRTVGDESDESAPFDVPIDRS